MPVFAVLRGNGPGYDPARPRRGQRLWDEHAAFMDALVEEGVVLLGGPVGTGSRVLLVVQARDGGEARRRLEDGDPWTPLEILTVERVEPWELWLDGRRRPGTG